MGGNLTGTIGGKSIIGTLGSCHIAMGKNVIPDWSQNDEAASDYIKNRPGGYTVNYHALNIEWDGVIGDRVSVDFGEAKYVKVSDEIPKAEQLVGGTLSFKQGDTSDAISITDEGIYKNGDSIYGILDG